MTSTFTSNLNLQLQGVGDNSNTWGTVLNTSVFGNIDLACGGSYATSVAGSSDFTLSATNALNFEHIITGVLTGNINYVFPATAGRYISIFNNTTGSFTVTVKQSGGTGIIVPQGATRLLKLSANTTTVSDILNNISALKVGIPSSLTGTMGFYNGSNANIAALRAGIMGSGVTWTLPIGDGTNGQIIQTDGTANLSWATAAVTNIVQTFTAAQRAAISTLTDASTITPDFSLANNYAVTLGGNRTLGTPTNLSPGQDGSIRIRQDSTGSRTLAYSWAWTFSNASTPTLSTTACTADDLYYSIKVGQSSTVTITIASPGVVTYTSHGLVTGQQIQLTTTGSLPTGLTASTTYYVVFVGTNTFQLATSLANAAAGTTINTSSSQSGTHTLAAVSIAATLTKAVA